MSAVEAMVAAAAQAAGPIDGDPGRWSDAVRRAAAAQVVIAADMGRLMEALSTPENESPHFMGVCKRYVRTVTGIRRSTADGDGGRFLIEFTPPISYTYKGKLTELTDISTDWCELPHSQMLAEIVRANIGRKCLLYQRNERPNEGDPEPPTAGYRRLALIEPLADDGEATAGRRPTKVVDMTERRQERAPTPRSVERQDGPIVGTDPTLPLEQKPSEALREMAQPAEDLPKAATEVVKLISPLLSEDERVRFQQEFVALLKHNALPPPSKWAGEPWEDKVCPAVKIYLRVCSQGKNPGLKAALFVAREMLGLPMVDVPVHEPDEEPW